MSKVEAIFPVDELHPLASRHLLWNPGFLVLSQKLLLLQMVTFASHACYKRLSHEVALYWLVIYLLVFCL